MIYTYTFSYYECLDKILEMLQAVVTAIAVTAAVAVPFLLVAGSVISTQNG